MSLPYNLDEEQTAKLFGNDAKITTLTSVVRDDQKKTLSISFGPVNSIEANNPYLVKVAADRQEFVLEVYIYFGQHQWSQFCFYSPS